MTAMFIHGLGALGGFGHGAGALAQAANAPNRKAAASLADTKALAELLPGRALRRMDHFTRLTLLGAFMALEDAGLKPRSQDMDGLGIILATGYGPAQLTFDFLDSIIEHGPGMASPLAFSHSVHNIPAASIALHCGTNGPVCTVSQFESSVTAALLTARTWLDEGRCRRVLLGAVDERTKFQEICYTRLYGTPGKRPLGDGAAFFVLENGKTNRYRSITRVALVRDETVALVPEIPNFLSGRHIGPRLESYQASGVHNAYAFTDAYGILPVGQAMDIIIGACCLTDFDPLVRHQVDTIQCSSADANGLYGIVELTGSTDA